MNRQIALYLWTAVGLIAASGASCPWARQTMVQPSPVVFNGTPPLQEVIAAINANSQPIIQLQTQAARIAVPGYPALRANLALERPRNMRLRAEMLSTPAMDLGSNGELFWIWTSQESETIYFARHEQFAGSAAADVLPVEPTWLIEALGVVYLDPQGRYEGPFPHGPGQLAIRSQIPTVRGVLTRTLVVHDLYGWILQQQIHDPHGRLLASASASDHRFYPLHRVSLPQHIELRIAPGQATQLVLEIDVSGYTINELTNPPAELWTLPAREGTKLVNLSDPRLKLTPATHQAAQWREPRYGNQPSAYRPQFRGYTRQVR